MNKKKQPVAPPEIRLSKSQRMVVASVGSGAILTGLSLLIGRKGDLIVCYANGLSSEHVMNRGFPLTFFPHLSIGCAENNITGSTIGFTAGDIPAVVIDFVVWSVVAGLVLWIISRIRKTT